METSTWRAVGAEGSEGRRLGGGMIKRADFLLHRLLSVFRFWLSVI